MGIHCCAAGELEAAMQTLGVGHTDLDPCRHASGQVSNKYGGLVARCDALREHNPVAILETIGDNAHEHVFDRF